MQLPAARRDFNLVNGRFSEVNHPLYAVALCEGVFAHRSFSEGVFAHRSFSEGVFAHRSFSEGVFAHRSFSEGVFAHRSFSEGVLRRGLNACSAGVQSAKSPVDFSGG